MQIKKDKIKSKLLQSAKEEFLEKGFGKASIRQIVKNADTTIGNFYNYFAGKEEIFSALVDDFYKEFKHLISYHHADKVRNEMLQSRDIDVWRNYLGELINPLMSMLNDRFLLLLEYSKDTKYANAKQELTEVLVEHFVEHIKEFAPEYKYKIMGEIISHQIITAIIEIIKTDEAPQVKQQLIVEEVLFCAIGVMGLLKGDINDIYTKP